MTTFTGVEIVFVPDRVNCWLRFGAPAARAFLDRRRSMAFFAPGEIFAYIRWFANEYGTQRWCCYVVKAGGSGEKMIRIPGVHPGVSCLGVFKGAALAKRYLQFADTLEKHGVDLINAPEAYWRQAHLRLPLRWAPHEIHHDDVKGAHVRRKALA